MLKTISKYISDYYGWLDSYSNIVTIEYDKFMVLVFESEKQLIGPDDIEKCWQALVLDTELYYNYCMVKFGKIIHYKILNSPSRNQEIEKTYKLYIGKYKNAPNKLVWFRKMFSKPIKHFIKQEIEINVWSKSGTKYFVLIHGFNSAENFGYIKEIIEFKYQISIDSMKLFVNKLNVPTLSISNICEFYKLDSKLEISDSINISGLYSFGIRSLDLIIDRI